MGSRNGASPAANATSPAALKGGADTRGHSDNSGDPLDHIRKQPIESVLTMQGSSRAGLTSEEAAQRQAREGKNLIESGKKRSPILAFLSNFTHLMAILLWVAGIIAFVAGMPELGCAVWLVNIINGVFSFWQEHRASQATEALKKMLPAYATVIRDGHEQKNPCRRPGSR